MRNFIKRVSGVVVENRGSKVREKRRSRTREKRSDRAGGNRTKEIESGNRA